MHPATDHDTGDSTAGTIIVRRLGQRGYADGCALQERAARAVAGGAPDELLYVEHPPTITLGRGASPQQMLASPSELADAGIAVVRTDRGGGATYHGPGQIIGYPIVDLRRRGLGVRAYLRALEAALATALSAVGVDAFPRPGLTGVWTRMGKVAAIGVAVRRGVTRHGFALNQAPDLSAFERIVPCGLPEPVTSLAQLGADASPATLQRAIAGALAETLRAPRTTVHAKGPAPATLATHTSAGAAQ
ncbi:MAG: lipoyl(octanoyl) transferase LipB [Acidobacteriota bacterium]|jgi:lipoyl(octanoyl) transferase